MMGPKKLRPWTHYIVPAIFVGGLFLMQIFGSPNDQQPLHVQGEALGTTWSLKVTNSPLEKGDIVRVQAGSEKVNLEMSATLTSQPCFNQHTDLQTGISVSDELTVLEAARYVHDQTFGAFDVTVGPWCGLGARCTQVRHSYPR